MKSAGFYIFFAINYLITLLPLRVLYLFSDLFYLLFYYLFRLQAQGGGRKPQKRISGKE